MGYEIHLINIFKIIYIYIYTHYSLLYSTDRYVICYIFWILIVISIYPMLYTHYRVCYIICHTLHIIYIYKLYIYVCALYYILYKLVNVVYTVHYI